MQIIKVSNPVMRIAHDGKKYIVGCANVLDGITPRLMFVYPGNDKPKEVFRFERRKSWDVVCWDVVYSWDFVQDGPNLYAVFTESTNTREGDKRTWFEIGDGDVKIHPIKKSVSDCFVGWADRKPLPTIHEIDWAFDDEDVEELDNVTFSGCTRSNNMVVLGFACQYEISHVARIIDLLYSPSTGDLVSQLKNGQVMVLSRRDEKLMHIFDLPGVRTINAIRTCISQDELTLAIGTDTGKLFIVDLDG